MTSEDEAWVALRVRASGPPQHCDAASERSWTDAGGYASSVGFTSESEWDAARCVLPGSLQSVCVPKDHLPLFVWRITREGRRDDSGAVEAALSAAESENEGAQ